MALPQGVNFRATGPYVTDGANEYCQIAPGTGGNYPTTTPQGNVVGWEGTAFGQVDSRDRSTTVDRRLAGSNFTTTAATATYRIDLPAAGTYNIRLAAGDASFTSNVQIELFDDTTSLGVLASATSLSGGQFKDATNATLTSATWPGSNTAVTKTFSSTICRIKVGNTAGSSRYINHFYIEAAMSGTTVAPTGTTLTLSTSAPTIGQATTLAPSGVGMTITGYAPSIVQPVTLTPAGVSMTITGYAPLVSQAQIVKPTGAALTITGYAPTITQLAPQTITPAGAAITLTGYAPQVWFGGNVPILPLATIMRANSISAQGGTLAARKDLPGGTMASALALATIMRAQATSRTAAIHSDPINLTVSFP